MHAAKTGALLSCASSIGAVLAAGDKEVVGALASFGIQVGIAFQAVDDQLGIWGRPELTGKPTWNDLRQRKSSLPVVAALDSDCDEAGRLRELLSRPDLSEPEIAEAAELVEPAAGGATRPRRPSAGSSSRCASWSGFRSTRPRARSSRASPASSSRESFDRDRPDASVQATLDRAVDHLLSLPVAGGLVEGRARDQRDHGRGGPPPPPVPRHPHRRANRDVGQVDPLEAAR